MTILGWLGIAYGVSILLGAGILLYDGYRYPVCPLCGSNIVRVFPGEFVCVKRVQKKIICPIHGELERR